MIDERMGGVVNALRVDLLGIRAGRATPALVERVRVEAYGGVLPLGQMATIAAPEPRVLTIRPWDASTTGAIERAIQGMGLTPNRDGPLIRVAIPPLTDERRKELAKIVGRRVEEARVAIRNVRRDGLKDKGLSEDEAYRARAELQALTDHYIGKADELGEQKQAEIMET